MKEALRQRALELGFDRCRFTSAAPPASAPAFMDWLGSGSHGSMAYLERNAHRRIDPQQVLAGARSFILLAVRYPAPPMPAPIKTPAGTVARYAQGADYHDILGPRLKELTAEVDRISPPETRSLWYVDTGPILERDLAQRAGIGFVGKHTNLIARDLGNWFFLAAILTTARLDPDEPERNRCGTCTRCLASCPTGAITAPFRLDARRCISYLTIELKGSIPVELRPLIGTRVFGCDDCLEVCPWNRFAHQARNAQPDSPPGLLTPYRRGEFAQPDLLDWLALDEPAFKQRFAHTPMARAKRRGLLRNVCVALGNLRDPATLPALEIASRDREPLIAEHAQWAISQIQAKTGEI